MGCPEGSNGIPVADANPGLITPFRAFLASEKPPIKGAMSGSQAMLDQVETFALIRVGKMPCDLLELFAG